MPCRHKHADIDASTAGSQLSHRRQCRPLIRLRAVKRVIDAGMRPAARAILVMIELWHRKKKKARRELGEAGSRGGVTPANVAASRLSSEKKSCKRKPSTHRASAAGSDTF